MEWSALVGVVLGLALGFSLPALYRRNVGRGDERAELIEEKAALRVLIQVQIVSGLGMIYSSLIAGEAGTVSFKILSLTFFIATFGHILAKLYYSRVM